MINIRPALFLIFILISGLATGQPPVYTSLRILPPYSVYLNDYVSAGSNRLQLDLRLDDENEASREVKLRFTIKGNNLTLQTKPDFNQGKILLTSGIQETYTGEDDAIAPYFYQQNLIFQGNSNAEQVFRRTNRLPEGYYQFYVEVLDYQRGTVISSQNVYSFAWLILNDPPRWILPTPNERVRATDPQNLLFQWLPMNTGSMNSAFNTEYEVTIAELWPVEQEANIALNSQSPFYQFTTGQTMFIMGPGEPSMTPGRKYAIRVRAKDKEGLDLFKNSGFSEPLVYTFGEECLYPVAIKATTPNYQTANLEWTGQPGNSEYLVAYREKGQTEWYVQEKIFFNNAALNKLKPGKEYEYRISALCGSIASHPTETAGFTTPVKPETVFECGKGDREAAGGPNGKANLSIGELITIRQHEIELTEVSGGSGLFTGKGIITVPFMSNIKMGVEFTGVTVNTENKITAGRVKFTSGKISVLPQELQDKLRPFAEGLDKAREYLNKLEKELGELNHFLTTVKDLPEEARHKIQEGIDQVNKGKSEVRAKNTTAGNLDIAAGQQKIQEGINIAAKALGTQIKMPAPSSSSTPATSTSDKLKSNNHVKITFSQSKAPGTTGGFDEKKHSQIENFYEQAIEEGTDTKVFIAWKAVEANRPDYVTAKVTLTSPAQASDVKFKDAGGALIPSQQTGMSGEDLQLTLQGGSEGQVKEIYASYSGTTSGTGSVTGTAHIAKLNVIAYQREQRKLVIVPVGINSNVPTDISTTLNNIYGQALAEWSVEIKPPVVFPEGWDESKDGKVEVGTSGLLSNYTLEMRNLISAYKDLDNGYDKDKYYLFVGLPPSDGGIMGYMPRAKNAGFIFSGASGAMEKTMAHELGHGAFHLKHTFDELGLPREDDNLMAYGTGTTLLKYQWDNIHDPVVVLGFLEDDSSGMVAQATADANLIFKCGNTVIKDGQALELQASNACAITAQYNSTITGNIEMRLEIKKHKKDSNGKDKKNNDGTFQIETTLVPISNKQSVAYNTLWQTDETSEEESRYTIYITLPTKTITRAFYVPEWKNETPVNDKNLVVYFGDHSVSGTNIFITEEIHDIKLKYVSTLTGEVEMQLECKAENATENFSANTPWKKVQNNSEWKITRTTLPEGKYIAMAKPNGVKVEKAFYIRHQKAEFPCKVCGRELKLSKSRLRSICENDNFATDEAVNYLNHGLSVAGFNSCYRQAHFFAQCKVESGNFTKFEEGTTYNINRFFVIFPNNKNTDLFYDQLFWDNNLHKGYFHSGVYEGVTTLTGTHKSTKTLDISRDGNSASIPIKFETKVNGTFKAWSATSAEKTNAVSNLFSLMYANNVGPGNGAPSTKDGYNYRGRGIIQLTGRGNYKDVASHANGLFKLSPQFDWETNYEIINSNNKDRIYSAIAFFHKALNSNLSLLDYENVLPVSKVVNGVKIVKDKDIDYDGDLDSRKSVNDEEGRQNEFDNLIINIFGQCIPK